MSFGDPNNPYGQQQGGQQPGYGYPQQTPQGVPQQGYGYPQAPPVQGGYGYPGAPTEMPGGVKAARVMLFVIAGFQVLGAVFAAFVAFAIGKAKDDPTLRDDIQFQEVANWSTGAAWATVLVILAWGVFALVLGLKLSKGGNGVRITTIVFGIVTALLGIYPFILILVGLVYTVLAVLVTVFVAKSDGGAWFNRQKQAQY
ncbi:hypothetical protein [Streptomyces clavifer]|uniref:hypothetical protein n=1 Tax=Streptomyces clavifer TaxID=68188 RepID=UPI0033AEEC24